ncbi:unnamed protein product [Alopecurus aequalis]
MDDGSDARATATASTNDLGGEDTTPTPDPEAVVTRSTSGGDSTEATASATNARGGGDSTEATDPEASATTATNGGGGGDSTEATDPDAAATNGGGGGEAPEPEQELERLRAYAAAYSGRTRVARLISIAKWSGVETTQLEALRLALVEVKRGRDTRRYGDICNLIDGRITSTYDSAWVESVDETFKQRLLALQQQMIQEAQTMDMRKGYTDMAELYYSHGYLPAAHKSLLMAEDLITSSQDLVQICFMAVLIDLERCKFDLVLHYVDMAERCQAPLDAVSIAKLHAAAGLAYLGKMEYELAALKFVEIIPELGSNYSEVISPADVAVYGALCALSSFNSAKMKSKVMENAKFLYFLRLQPQVWQLVHSFYNGDHRSCMNHLEAIKPHILPDIHIGEHVKTLYFVISQKSDYIVVPGLEDLFPASSPILIEGGTRLNEEREDEPRVEETQPQNVRVSNLVLPDEFDDETNLVVSAHYKFLKAKELLVSIGKRSLSWVSRLNAYALLINGQLFVDDSVDDKEGRFDGRIAIVSEAKRVRAEICYSSYTTTRKTLKETRILDKEDSAVDRFQIKGNVWTRRRICLKNDQRYHLLQWRKSAGLRRAQAQPPEAASQNNNAQLNETMNSLIDQLKDHTNAVTHNTEILTQTRQIMLELNNSLAEARTTAATARTEGEAP